MKSTYHQILDLLRQAFAENQDRSLKGQYLHNAAVLILKEGDEGRQAILQHILKSGKRLAGNQQVLLKSLVFYLAKSDTSIKDVAALLTNYTDNLEEYHYLFWKIRQSMFNFSGFLSPEASFDVREKYMRPSYHKVMAAIKECIQNEQAYKPAPQLKRIAIVLSQFLGDLHAPSRTALMIATGLRCDYDIEVHIINSNLLPFTRPLDYFYGLVPNVNEGFQGKQSVRYDDAEFGMQVFTVKTYNPHQFDLSYLVDVWNDLESENYDGFINLGDVVFATDYFFGRLPVLCIPTVKEMPTSFADQVIMSQESVTSEEKLILEKNFPCEPILGFSFNIAAHDVEHDISKASLNIPEDGFVFVVVGNRLLYEIDASFMAMIRSLIDGNPKNYVLFAAGQEPVANLLATHNQGIEDRLRYVGFQQNLKGFYSACDVYLNPTRSGGGVSAQMALMAKIPVLTSSHGDVGALLPPEYRLDTYDAMGQLALKLSLNPDLFLKWQNHMAERSTARLSARHNIDLLYQRLQALHQDKITQFENQNNPSPVGN